MNIVCAHKYDGYMSNIYYSPSGFFITIPCCHRYCRTQCCAHSCRCCCCRTQCCARFCHCCSYCGPWSWDLLDIHSKYHFLSFLAFQLPSPRSKPQIVLKLITTAKISNKFSRESPYISNSLLRESQKISTNFHVSKRSPLHSKDLTGFL